jgi:hypothetical protein
MNSIKKWLQSNGFTFKEVMLTDGKSGIMVETDYEGLYPTKECIKKQRTIATKIRRYKNLKAETRGYHTAVLITAN